MFRLRWSGVARAGSRHRAQQDHRVEAGSGLSRLGEHHPDGGQRGVLATRSQGRPDDRPLPLGPSKRIEHAPNWPIASLGLHEYILEATTSYVSVVELGLYDSTIKLYEETVGRGRDRSEQMGTWKERVRAAHGRAGGRLCHLACGQAVAALVKYLCFYPMDKKRGEQRNWYTVPIDKTAADMMREHGMIGRRFAGRVQADHFRFDRLRRLGMGCGLVRRRPARFQTAHL